MQETPIQLVKRLEENYNAGTFQKSKYVTVNPKEDIDTIDAYLNSKFISNPDDDRPFFDIVTFARDIWYRATGSDRKNIKVKSDKQSQQLMAILGDAHTQRWMKEVNFGQFLNNWGLTLAGYNSAISKWVEKDGELIPLVIPWQQIICDHVDFKGNPKIEKLYFTPAQLRMNTAYDQEVVEQLIEDVKATRKTSGGQSKDQKADYIEVHELHGNLPLSYLTDNDDDDTTYQQQMHALTFTAKGNKTNDYVLYKGREKKDPYRLASLLPSDDGSISLWGAVKRKFQAQWMKNHTIQLTKEQLELASLILLQTNDANFVGRNALTNIVNGEVLTYTKDSNPLTPINNKADIAPLQAFGQDWERQGERGTGISESMMGDTAPSGTAWRQVETLLQESHSLFKEMRQNKDLAIEEFCNDFIAPYIQKKMDTNEEIEATLEGYQIKMIDRAFVPQEAIRVANRQIKEDILNGKITQQPDLKAIESQIQSKLNENGNKRFFKPSDIVTKKWKEVLKDLKFMYECDTTNEQIDNQAAMATYDTILKFIMGLQGRPMTPTEEFIFNKLLMRTGYISPIELSQLSQNQQLPMGQPVNPPVVGGGPMTGGLQTQMR